MKIVIAVHHFPPNFRGGAELMSYRLAIALQARGWEVDVVCVERIDRGPANGVDWRDEEYDNLRVRRLELDLGAAPDPWLWSYDNPWIGTHLEEWWKIERPDVVLLVGGYLLTTSVLSAAHHLAIPTAVRLTDFWFLCPRIHLLRSDGSLSTPPLDPIRCAQCLGEESRRYRIPARFFPGLMQRFWQQQGAAVERVQARTQVLRERLANARVLLTESAFLRDVFTAAGIPSQQIVQMRQGIDATIVPPVVRTSSASLRVGYFGQIVQPKGVHVLIEAITQHPDLALRLDLFGDAGRDPSYTASLRRKAAGDSRIRWCDFLRSPEAVRDALHNLDVVCVPSIWYENSPNVILEAFAAGVPVVTSDLGGMAELVQHDHNGLLFATGDSTALSRHLRDLAAQPDLLARLRSGIAPMRRMKEEVDELDAIFRDLASSVPRRKPQQVPEPPEVPLNS